MWKGKKCWAAGLCGLPIILFWLLPTAVAAQQDFDQWLVDLRLEAAARGISEATLAAALADVRPLPRVIELDRRQPESILTASEYLRSVLSPQRIAAAQERRREYAPLLQSIGKKYGVPPRILVALWGIESYFGTRAGDFRVVDALATLAWEGRRAAFFRRELLNALQIIDQGHVSAAQMKGSWAGAMGQFQFMPSTFQRFAVDYDNDGRKDIWSDPADAFASAANYLSKAGWQPGRGWGQRVKVPAGFDPALAGLDAGKSLAKWRTLGVKNIQGPAKRQAYLLLPEGVEGPAFLVNDNFRVLLDWNRSTYFALAVGLLADEVSADGKAAVIDPDPEADKIEHIFRGV